MGDKSPKSKQKNMKQKESVIAKAAVKAQSEKDAKAVNAAKFKR